MSGATGTRIAGWMALAAIPILAIGSALFAIPLFPSGSDPSFTEFSLRRMAMLVGGGGLMLIGALVGSLGLALYVMIPAFSGSDRARRDYGSHKVVLACTVLAIVLGNLAAALYFLPAGFIFSGSRGRGLITNMLSPAGLAASAFALDACLVGVVYLRIVRPGAITWKRMGLERKNLARRLLLGLGLGVLLLAASTVLAMAMEGAGIRQNQTQLFGSVRGASPAELLLILFSGAVIAPIVEEVYFRGFVFSAYLDQKGLRRAFVFSAGLFATVHLNPAALVPIFVMGLLLSLFFYRSGSIIPGIVAHAFNNAAAFLLLYIGLQ